jgi:hypothetical protein
MKQAISKHCWKWRQYASLKRLLPFTGPHDIIFQKTTLPNISWLLGLGAVESNEVFLGYQPCQYHVSVQQKIGLFNTSGLTTGAKKSPKRWKFAPCWHGQSLKKPLVKFLFSLPCPPRNVTFDCRPFLQYKFLESQKFHVKAGFRLIQVLL